MSRLIIALPKGRMGSDTWRLLQANDTQETPFDDRLLVVDDPEKNLRYLWVKPSDVITYVSEGVADCGIVGEDVLEEQTPDVYRLLALPFGQCRLAVAGYPGTDLYPQTPLRIATKYPHVTRRYFRQKNQKITLFSLQGSVELAPIVGLSDVIVDVVETGSTLKANNLTVLEDILTSQAMLIANKAKYRTKHEDIHRLVASLKEGLNE